MANIFKPKRSSTSSSVPTTGDLTDGELAVNSADKIIYLRDGGSIVEVANYSTVSGGGGESYWVSNDVGIHTLSNVGVGTTNPTSKLTVEGDVLVSGVITATNIPEYYFQSNAPSSPNVGDKWVDDTDGITYIYYNDGNSSQWIEFGPTPIEYTTSTSETISPFLLMGA